MFSCALEIIKFILQKKISIFRVKKGKRTFQHFVTQTFPFFVNNIKGREGSFY